MKAVVLYRIASVIFVLFASGHTMGFLRFSAFLAWHLGGLANRDPQAIGALGWAFCAVQVASLALGWIYFFPVTAAFSGLLAVCLGWAAWLVN